MAKEAKEEKAERQLKGQIGKIRFNEVNKSDKTVRIDTSKDPKIGG